MIEVGKQKFHFVLKGEDLPLQTTVPESLPLGGLSLGVVQKVRDRAVEYGGEWRDFSITVRYCSGRFACKKKRIPSSLC